VRRVVAALTFPGEAVGEVVANLRISDDFVVADTEKALHEAGAASEPKRAAKDIGEEWGRVSSESFGRRLGREGPTIARELEQGLRGRRIRLPDIDGNETGRRWSRSLGTGLATAVAGSSLFNNIGRTISDAIGAGFNVSGRSPLITLILPIIGAIVALVLAAVHGLHALVALLYSVPNILFAIGLQAGVLLLIFQGVGQAITTAFQAKNATELKEALKGLNPQLAYFIKTLLPIKDIYKSLQGIAQTNFFGAFDFGGSNPVIDLLKGLTSLPRVIAQVANQLGYLFRSVFEFFASPLFNQFFKKMGDSVVRFLKGFETGLGNLLLGLTNFGVALIPFADKVGAGFNDMLSTIGGWLTKLSNDKDFLAWLDRAIGVLGLLLDLGYAIVQFFMTLAQVLDETGTGDQLLIQLKEFIQILSFLMQTEGGRKAIEGLVHAALILTAAFVGLVIIVGFVLASLESFFEWLRYEAWPWLEENVPKIGAIFLALIDDIFGIIGKIFTLFPQLLMWIGTKIAEGLKWLWDKIVEFFKSIPNSILRITSGWGSLLFEAGKNIIQGLINGIKEKANGIGNVISGVVSKIVSFFPHSPAKEGPMSGQGDPYYSGQAIVGRLSAGIASMDPLAGSVTADVMNSINNVIRMATPVQQAAATPVAPAATTDQQPQIINVGVRIGDQDIKDIVEVEISKVMRIFSQQLLYGTRAA
jgi:hypothetical protein